MKTTLQKLYSVHNVTHKKTEIVEMVASRSIVDEIKGDLEKSQVRHGKPSVKQIIGELAPDIHARLKQGLRLEDVYQIIRARLPEETQLTLNTFKKYWREARDEKGLPKARNTGRKKNPKTDSTSKAEVTPSVPSAATSAENANPRKNTITGLRTDPSHI